MNNFSSRTNWKGGQHCRIVASQPLPDFLLSCLGRGRAQLFFQWLPMLYYNYMGIPGILVPQTRGTRAFPHGHYKKIAHHTQRAIAGKKKKESRPLISSARRRSGKRRARIKAAKIEGKKVRRAFFCCYPCDDIVPESSLLLFAGKKFFYFCVVISNSRSTELLFYMRTPM